jgi:hypothetical protein
MAAFGTTTKKLICKPPYLQPIPKLHKDEIDTRLPQSFAYKTRK